MNTLLALMWITTGAVAIGVSTGLARRHWDTPTKLMAAGVVSAGAWIAGCVWLGVSTVTALSPTIDSPQPGQVSCDSAWSELQDSLYLNTDAGPTFDPSHGACQAAAWRHVASVGTTELGLAVLLGAPSVLLIRRRRHDPKRIADRVTV